MKELTGRMADRNRELVPDIWSLVTERALTTGQPGQKRECDNSLGKKSQNFEANKTSVSVKSNSLWADKKTTYNVETIEQHETVHSKS